MNRYTDTHRKKKTSLNELEFHEVVARVTQNLSNMLNCSSMIPMNEMHDSIIPSCIRLNSAQGQVSGTVPIIGVLLFSNNVFRNLLAKEESSGNEG